MARFEAKLDRSGEHHLWLGAHKSDGMGMFKADAGSPVLARRVAWRIAYGPVPAGARRAAKRRRASASSISGR
jgi:hypothetical protein